MKLIIIAGMPASGKSTVAGKLAERFNFPVLEKDNIKEELFDTLGFNSYPEKRSMDVAATAVLLRVAADMLSCGQSLIMVNNFRDDAKEALKQLIKKHRPECVLVFFDGNADVFYKRYVERDNNHLRHLGHIVQEHYPPREGDPVDYEMTREEFAGKFEKLGMSSLDIGTPKITIDATYPETIDIESLCADINRSFAKPCP